MLTSSSNVQLRECRRNRAAWDDDHDVGVPGKHVYEGREMRISHFHALKLSLRLRARQLELLYYIRYPLAPEMSRG